MRKLLLVVALIAFSCGELCATNGLAPIGYGVRSKGMGGVGVALPQDSFVVALNPAGLSCLGSGAEVELGYTFQDAFISTTRTASLPPFITVDGSSDRGVWWPAIGARARCNDCLSVGVAAYVLGANDMSWDTALGILQAVAPSDPTTHTRMQNYYMAITPAVAWSVSRCHSVGVAASVVVATTNVAGVRRNEFRSALPRFVTGNGVDTATGVNLRVGWLGRFCSNRLHVGASLATKSYMSRFSKYQGLIGDYGAFQWPWNAALGIAWYLRRSLVLSVDYNYYQWRSVDGMRFTFYVNQLNRGRSTEGLWDGEGFGWNNQSVAKVGLAWSCFRCLTLRAGYNYAEPVIASSELLLVPLTGSIIKNHITAGITYNSCIGQFSGYYLHGFRRTLRSTSELEQGGTDESAVMRNEQNEIGLAWGVCF